MKQERPDHSMYSYGVSLIKHSSDTFSILTLIIFALSVFSGWVNIDNEFVVKVKNLFGYFSLPLLFILLFRSGFKVWENEILKFINPVFTLIPRAKNLTLQNRGTIHPDSQANIFFELNISNTSGTDFTIQNIDLTKLEPFSKFFTDKCRSRFVDLQNNHHEFHMPKMVANGASDHFFIELSYLPIPISKKDTQYPTVPSHIIEFAPKLRDIQDFHGEVEITYLLKGHVYKKNIKIPISLTCYKEHFIEKWSDYKWDHAVTLANHMT